MSQCLRAFTIGGIFLSAINVASASEINRNKFAQFGDPLTPPQSRTSCNGWNSGDWPWPARGGWKTCASWKTEFRHIEVEYFIVLNGPSDINDDIKRAANQCLLVAGAAAAGAGYASGGSAALAAGKIAFSACIGTKAQEFADKFDLSIDTPSHWTDWA